MSDKIYLQVDDVVLPVEPKRGYTVNLSDSELVSETEAGTHRRTVYRNGVPSIAVKFWCDLEMLQQMRTLKNKTSVLVKYFDPLENPDTDGNRLVKNLMYITDYKEDMLADTDELGIWSVSFDLEDLSDNV